jgi:hypothetical protein
LSFITLSPDRFLKGADPGLICRFRKPDGHARQAAVNPERG